MIILPIPTTGGNMSGKGLLAMLIVLNLIIAILGITAYYYYTQETYPGTFWDWSWDGQDSIMHEAKNDWGMIFWTVFFAIDGIALFVLAVAGVAKLLGEE